MNSKLTVPTTPETEQAGLVPSLADAAPSALTAVPPTDGGPTPERTSKLTVVGRYRGGWMGYSCATVPEIRFGGKYLEEFRFPIGTRLHISVKKGRIIIKPDSYQPWLPEDVAMEVREASAMENS